MIGHLQPPFHPDRRVVLATLVGAMMALAALALAFSASSAIRHVDRKTVAGAREEASENDYDWGPALSAVGSDIVAVALGGVSVIGLAATRRPREARALGSAICFAALLVLVLSSLDGRSPPHSLEAVGGGGGVNFPTGYAAIPIAVYATLTAIAARSSRGGARRAVIAVGAVATACVLGGGAALGLAYPTDLGCGLLGGIAAALVGVQLLETPPLAGKLGARSALKRVPGVVPAVRVGRRAAEELNALIHAVAGPLADALASARGHQELRGQAPVDHPGVGDLEALAARGFAIENGALASYIPPAPGLGTPLGADSVYPRDAALRVVERELRIEDALPVANLLWLRGIGPRVYDGFALPGEHGDRTGFAISDPRGEAPAAAPSSTVSELRRLIDRRDLIALDERWDDPAHFRTTRGGEPVYVGFESFRLRSQRAILREILDEGRADLHYGTEYAVRGRRYLYQSVPAALTGGRRNTRRRWHALRRLLGESGLSVRGRVVLDLGCNAGMMMAAALSDGAAWAVGWDLPHVVRHNRPLLLALGYTRFDMFGADLTPDYALLGDIRDPLRPRLDGAIVLYLALRHNVGYFVSSVADLPWTAMVYEGGEEESVATLDRHLAELAELCDFEVAAAVDFRDSETGARPLAVLVRS